MTTNNNQTEPPDFGRSYTECFHRYNTGYKNQRYQDIRHEMDEYVRFSNHSEADYITARMNLLTTACFEICGHQGSFYRNATLMLAHCTYHMGKDLYTSIYHYLQQFEPASAKEAKLPNTYLSLCQALEKVDHAHKAVAEALRTVCSLEQPYPAIWIAGAVENAVVALRSTLRKDAFTEYRRSKLKAALTLIQSALEFKD